MPNLQVLLPALLLASMAFAAPPLNDCTAPAWVARTGKLYTTLAAMKCQTQEVRVVPGIDVALRVVQDQDRLEADVASWSTLVLDSAVTALAAYRALSSTVAIKNVTFILSPTQSGNTVAAADEGLAGECLVVVLTKANSVLTPQGRSEEVPVAIAHELAHCLQHWNVPQRMLVDKSTREWWVEGSAEYLGGRIFPSPKDVLARSLDFAESTKPLTQQSYDNMVFFSWYAQQQGPAALFGFWSGMPTAQGEAAQRSALLAKVGAPGLQAFARAWVEGKIDGPGGAKLPVPMLTPMTFFGDATRSVEAEPFSVLRGEMVFQDGEYTLTTTSTGTPAPRFRRGSEPWVDKVTQSGSFCEEKPTTRFAGIPTSGNQKLQVVGKKNSPPDQAPDCSPKPAACIPLEKADPCLEGQWALDELEVEKSVDAAIDGLFIPTDVTGTSTLSLGKGGKEGAFAYDDFDIVVGNTIDETAVLYSTNVTGALAGGWSTGPNGAFRLCATQNSTVIKTAVKLFSGDGKPINTEVSLEGGATTDLQYTCSGNSLILKAPEVNTSKGAPLVWVFKKTGGGGCSVAPGAMGVGLLALAAARRGRGRSKR